MSDKQSVSGRCLCNKVTLKGEVGKHFEVCHCGICRKWGGGPLMAVHFKEGELVLEGDENLTRFDSSGWAERAFCQHCGTHVYYRFKQSGDYVIPLGFLEGGDFSMREQIFIDKKPGYYEFSNDTKTLTEKEVFELYAG